MLLCMVSTINSNTATSSKILLMSRPGAFPWPFKAANTRRTNLLLWTVGSAAPAPLIFPIPQAGFHDVLINLEAKGLLNTGRLRDFLFYLHYSGFPSGLRSTEGQFGDHLSIGLFIYPSIQYSLSVYHVLVTVEDGKDPQWARQSLHSNERNR